MCPQTGVAGAQVRVSISSRWYAVAPCAAAGACSEAYFPSRRPSASPRAISRAICNQDPRRILIQHQE